MFIVCVNGVNIGKVYPLDQVELVVIGRSDGCDIRFLDMKISRNHCQIRKKLDGYFIKDLGSTNKTILNGEVIEDERKLEVGDLIDLGDVTLLVTKQRHVAIKDVELYRKMRVSRTMKIDLPQDEIGGNK